MVLRVSRRDTKAHGPNRRLISENARDRSRRSRGGHHDQSFPSSSCTRRSLLLDALFLFETRCLLLIAACAAAISLWRHLAVTQRAIRSNRASGRGRYVYLPFFVPSFISPSFFSTSFLFFLLGRHGNNRGAFALFVSSSSFKRILPVEVGLLMRECPLGVASLIFHDTMSGDEFISCKIYLH